MLIHPWDAPREDAEWQQWLSAHDFGQLAVNGPPGEPPFVQPLHFAYDPDAGEAVTHLARPNPLWSALQANPTVTLSVVDDHVFVPGPWQAPPGAPAEHGTPTSFYTAVQLSCTAHIVDEPAAKADLLHRQLGHFQPEGGSARPTVGEEPYGRMLSGIRGIRLEVTAVRAKFKYAAHRPPETQDRIATGLAARGGPGDAAALTHLLRRRRT
ncbi:FMN-binding negative transcriptional regulator [Streptomyces sp. ME18-1-4]|uniref:FMN-binding negative transcriptional regulator n=1 Tax=Streptomyces sp. ME18-1-4 TaxID=3028685 RepID=UPI0029B77317|nr:FMN-binding negative transcriptional regulator [Streptomyces sp. ME18-1-4]MDX3248607.1 FMN-binding negative transcriptional regulator [Streptomyces sp. ME18-1-4]